MITTQLAINPSTILSSIASTSTMLDVNTSKQRHKYYPNLVSNSDNYSILVRTTMILNSDTTSIKNSYGRVLFVYLSYYTSGNN
jgi:hypothetical protein